jgi:MYXO-CTERM domain-containing protein
MRAMSRPSPVRFALPFALALAPALVSTPARAEVGVAPFAPVHEQKLVGLDDFTLDWFPMNAPLQLRLIAHGGNSVQIDMPGVGNYDWAAQTIAFVGDPQAGRLGVDVGFTLDALVRFDVLGVKWESDIIGPYDYAVIAEDDFTPYLLINNPDRPVVINDQTDPVTLVSVPVTPDIIVASGNLDIDIYVIVEASLEGHVIEANTSEPELQMATVVFEGEAVTLPAGPGPLPDPLLVDGTLVCGLATAPTVVLKPTLVMEILGQKFEVANIEVPVAIPPFDDVVRFAPVAMSFPRPPAAPDGDSEGDSHGYSSSESDSDTPTGSDGDEPTAGDAGDTDDIDSESGGEAGGALPPGDDGCECATGGRGPAPLLLLALLGLRRRRR